MGELIKDKSFDLNKTSEYKLSIQVSLDGFSFFILSVQEKKLLAFRYDKLKISNESFIARRFSEWLEEEEWTTRNFNQVEIFYTTSRFTLVPEEYYEETKKQELFHLLFPPAPNEQLEMNKLAASENRLLFAVQSRWKKEITEKFGNDIKHPVAVLTEKMINSDSGKNDSLGLFFNRNTFFAMLVKNGRLMFSNSFPFSHVNDVVYYTLSTLKQFEAAPKNTRLLAAGEINREDELSGWLKKYFPRFDYFSPDASPAMDTDLFGFQIHQHLPLLNQ